MVRTTQTDGDVALINPSWSLIWQVATWCADQRGFGAQCRLIYSTHLPEIRRRSDGAERVIVDAASGLDELGPLLDGAGGLRPSEWMVYAEAGEAAIEIEVRTRGLTYLSGPLNAEAWKELLGCETGDGQARFARRRRA